MYVSRTRTASGICPSHHLDTTATLVQVRQVVHVCRSPLLGLPFLGRKNADVQRLRTVPVAEVQVVFHPHVLRDVTVVIVPDEDLRVSLAQHKMLGMEENIHSHAEILLQFAISLDETPSLRRIVHSDLPDYAGGRWPLLVHVAATVRWQLTISTTGMSVRIAHVIRRTPSAAAGTTPVLRGRVPQKRGDRINTIEVAAEVGEHGLGSWIPGSGNVIVNRIRAHITVAHLTTVCVAARKISVDVHSPWQGAVRRIFESVRKKRRPAVSFSCLHGYLYLR
jgi:hypothetical protein